MRRIGPILSAVLLAGCLTTAQQFAGEGPITISPETAKALEWHKKLGGYLAVSRDGNHHAMSYCSGGDCNSADLDILNTLGECRDKARSDCWLLAQDGVVVWRGAVQIRR